MTNIGNLRTTNDNEAGKMPPVPSGCGGSQTNTSLSASALEPPRPLASASFGRASTRNAVRPNSVSRP